MGKAPFHVRELSGFGAEVVGFDPGAEPSADDRARLYSAWIEHGILVFRNSVHSNKELLALSNCFGELAKHPAKQLWVDGEPHLIQLGGDKKGMGFVYDGRIAAGAIGWHRDTSFTTNICKGAMLRMVKTPGKDGETLFADTAKAYAALPQEMKKRIEGLEIVMTRRNDPLEVRYGRFWKEVREATASEMPGQTNIVTDRFPSVVHPLVFAHPETGKKVLGMSPVNLDGILGLDEKESDELLSTLVSHATRAEFTYRHVWGEDDAIIWDNRRCLHAAMGYDPSDYRLVFRTTLAGDFVTGRPFDPRDRSQSDTAMFE